jgi:hypothetical protein
LWPNQVRVCCMLCKRAVYSHLKGAPTQPNEEGALCVWHHEQLAWCASEQCAEGGGKARQHHACSREIVFEEDHVQQPAISVDKGHLQYKWELRWYLDRLSYGLLILCMRGIETCPRVCLWNEDSWHEGNSKTLNPETLTLLKIWERWVVFPSFLFKGNIEKFFRFLLNDNTARVSIASRISISYGVSF